MISIKEKQRNHVSRMLSSKQVKLGEDEWSDEWKILIYDRKCRDIISTLFNVSQLRKKGVTLHLLIDSDRESIPNAPAVYFCEPKEENLRRIVHDLSRRLYSSIQIHFSSNIESGLLDYFATECVKCGEVSSINKIYDQFTNFVSLEPNLFSFNEEDTYFCYNNPQASEEDIKNRMDSIANGLLDVVVTFGAVPIITSLKNGPSRMIAEKLNLLIQENLSYGGNLFTNFSTISQQRPIVILLDRNIDLITPLRHSSTYQALLDDTLEHRVNRVTLSLQVGAVERNKTYDVDCETDKFYMQYKGASFPLAIEANSVELSTLTEQEDDIRRKTGSMGIDLNSEAALNTFAGNDPNTKDLAQAVELLPKLLERKKALEMHTNILKSIMDVIAARQIPLYFEAEEQIITSTKSDQGSLRELIGSMGKGSINDKIRLLCIYVLANKPSSNEFLELESLLKKSCTETFELELVEAGLRALKFIRNQMNLQQMPSNMQNFNSEVDLKNSIGSKYWQDFLSKAQTQATGLLTKAAQTAGQLLSKPNMTYVTKIVETLLDHNESGELYFQVDPRKKIGEKSVTAEVKLRGNSEKNIIIFMIGGGNYFEFQNLQDFAQRRNSNSNNSVSIIYGCTDLICADKFIKQLSLLGSF